MSDQTFSVHPLNPRCFQYRGKPFKILTSGEHYGAVINADLDYDVYLHEMQRTGQNMARVFTFYREKPSSIPGPGNMNTLAPTPPASVMPWERVHGHGSATDGLDRFDLERWNYDYFDRLADYVSRCADRGVVCEIVLFCNPYRPELYDLFPCNQLNNVNGVGTHIDQPCEFMSLKDATIVAFQERFIRQMAKMLNASDNVYYEICNEPTPLDEVSEAREEAIVAWQAHLARVLREAEEHLPKRHLIAVNAQLMVKVRDSADGVTVRHEDEVYFENPDIDIINYHYISAKSARQGFRFVKLPSDQAQAGLIWHFMRRRDHVEKPIVFDETFSGIARGHPERYGINRAEAWEMMLSGGAGYDNLDWSFTPADASGCGREPLEDGRRLDGRCLRDWLGVLRALLGGYDLAALTPALELLPERLPGYGYAASTDGSGRYILYLVDGRLYRSEACLREPLSTVLNLPAGTYAAQTFDPRSGVRRELPRVRSTGSARLDIPAFTEDIAVTLDRH